MGRKVLTVHLTGAGHKNKRPGVNQIKPFSIMLDQSGKVRKFFQPDLWQTWYTIYVNT